MTDQSRHRVAKTKAWFWGITQIVTAMAALIMLGSWVYGLYRPDHRLDVVTVCDRVLGPLPEYENTPIRLVWKERLGVESPRYIPFENAAVSGFEVRNSGRNVYEWATVDEPALEFVARSDVQILDFDTHASSVDGSTIPSRISVDSAWQTVSIRANFLKPGEVIHVWIVHTGTPGQITVRGRFKSPVRHITRMNPRYMGTMAWSSAGAFSVSLMLGWIAVGWPLVYEWRKSTLSEGRRDTLYWSGQAPVIGSILPSFAAYLLLEPFGLWKNTELAVTIFILQFLLTFSLSALVLWKVTPDGKQMLVSLLEGTLQRK